MALFNLPIQQLRENFICARFAEEQYFQNANIEAWVAAQRTAERPEYDDAAEDSPWNTMLSNGFLDLAANEPALELLQAHASRSTQAPNWFMRGTGSAYRGQLLPLLRALDRGGAHLYWPNILGGPIVVCADADGQPTAQTFEWDHEYLITLKPLSSYHVLSAIFETWHRGWPMATQARQFLCDRLASSIARVRNRADTEFVLAVAVSSDGRKIVDADWVVVITTKGEPVGLHAARFLYRAIKILRCPNMDRVSVSIKRERDPTWSDQHTRALQLFGTRTTGQLLVELNYLGERHKVLVTDQSFCPDPLPPDE